MKDKKENKIAEIFARRMIFEATHHPPFPTWKDYEKLGVIIIKDKTDD